MSARIRMLTLATFLLIASVEPLLAQRASPVSFPAALVITAEPPEIVDPGLPFAMDIVLLNHGPYLARDVRVTIEAPEVEGLEGPNECTTAGAGRLLCEIGVLGDRPLRLTIRGVAPADASGRSFSVAATIDGGDNAPDVGSDTTGVTISTWRTFYVSNESDGGEGSLRHAIGEANASCSDDPRCKVAFRIDPDGDGWATIAPQTPLPEINGTGVFVDATTQTRFFGDTNPFGPEVELSGELLEATGNGLQINAASNAAVRGLAINRFPEAGIAVAGVRDGLSEWYWDRTISSISDCYIGTDPTGTTALANSVGVRVSVYGDRTQFLGIWWINDNLISGNRRSGVFSVSGTREIRGNRIGVNRDLTDAIGNGASGVFIGPDNADITVEANTIAFNAEFGIAVAEGARTPLLLSNSIHSNGALGIDVGLDGVTMTRRVAGQEQPEALFELPVIWGANWDSSQGTVVEGAVPHPYRFPSTEYLISVYASDQPDPSGYGEGQVFLGTVQAAEGGHFIFIHSSDLRGKFVTVTASAAGEFRFPSFDAVESARKWGTTSEFSQAVPVQ